jgi:hypothetical protein
MTRAVPLELNDPEQAELVWGTSEIRNWLVLAGATENLDVEVLD